MKKIPAWQLRVRAAQVRGARLLDRLDPGWAKKVDPFLLDLCDPHTCVLGQWGKGYVTGLLEMYDRADKAGVLVKGRRQYRELSPTHYGFALRSDRDEHWSYLTERWAAAIERRRRRAA